MKLLLNGRFKLQHVSGVQNYARCVNKSLTEILGSSDVEVLTPASSRRSNGPEGLLWEQLILPLSADRKGGDVLLNLCNWAPVVIHPRQPSVLVLHDLMTSDVPHAYSRTYRMVRDAFHARLRRDPAIRIVAASQSAKLALEDYFQRQIDLAEGGVAPPSTDELDAYRTLSRKALGDVRAYVLLVGGHDPRKNAAFAISLTPALAAMGLRLVVTVRRDTAVFRSQNIEDSADVTVIEDPSYAVLWGLYAGALAVLQPSEAEAFGMPLLEAAAIGTPFISTDVGIARRLAADDRQVLPLDSWAWEKSIEFLLKENSNIAVRLGEAAKGYTWHDTAKSLIGSCEIALGRSG